LINNAPPPLTEECLDQLLVEYFETAKEDSRHIEIGQELISNYLCLLRSTVARYLYHWPVSRRFLDEMISTGAEAIAQIIVKLHPAQLKKDISNFQALGGLVENAIRHDIETTINNFRGIAPASERTNRGREMQNQKPIYGNIETGLANENVTDTCEYRDIESFIFETEDAIETIAETEFERQVLARENWGLSNAELGKKLDKSSRWVFTVRNRLRKRYQKLGEINV
jgi:hypothetical protein